MSKRRKFTPQFKSQVVLQLLSGERSMAELCREHQLTAQMIGNWKQQFLAAAPQVFEKNGADSDEQARIAAPSYRLQLPLYTRNLKHFAPLLGKLAQEPY